MNTRNYVVVVNVDRAYYNPEYTIEIAFANTPMRYSNGLVTNDSGHIKDIMLTSTTYDDICSCMDSDNPDYAGFFTKDDANAILKHYNNDDFNAHAKKYTLQEFRTSFSWDKTVRHHTPFTLLIGEINHSPRQLKLKESTIINHLAHFQLPEDKRYTLVGAVDGNQFDISCSYIDYTGDNDAVTMRNMDGSANIAVIANTSFYNDIIKSHDYWFTYDDAKKLQKAWSAPFDNHMKIYSYNQFKKHFSYLDYKLDHSSKEWKMRYDAAYNIRYSKPTSNSSHEVNKLDVIDLLRSQNRALSQLDIHFNDYSLNDLHHLIRELIHDSRIKTHHIIKS